MAPNDDGLDRRVPLEHLAGCSIEDGAERSLFVPCQPLLSRSDVNQVLTPLWTAKQWVVSAVTDDLLQGYGSGCCHY